MPLDPWGGQYYFDSDYECLADTVGCNGVTDTDSDILGTTYSSVIVSCGPNQQLENNACAYDEDNVVLRFCGYP